MNLESKFFYRLVKVMHNFWLLVTAAIIIFAIHSNFPSRIVDNHKSSIACNNGKNYSFEEANVFLNNSDFFDDTNDRQAKIICQVGPPITDKSLIKEIEKRPSVNFSDWEIVEAPKETNYSLHLQYQSKSIKEIWHVVSPYVTTFLIVFIILNIIQETLLYLAFGKKFSWRWLFLFG